MSEQKTIISRDDARASGLRVFFTGEPCRSGHLSDRLVSSSACVECRRVYYDKNREAINEKTKAYAKNNPARMAQLSRNYVARNPEKAAAAKRRYAQANPEKVRESKKRHAELNAAKIVERKRLEYIAARDAILARRRRYVAENKEKISSWKKVYRIENRGLITAENARRKARKRRATPSWADWEKIKQIYSEAARLGLHVDHIIPIKSKYVCGLHVESNLQLLTPEENLKKGTKFNPKDHEWSIKCQQSNRRK